MNKEDWQAIQREKEARTLLKLTEDQILKLGFHVFFPCSTPTPYNGVRLSHRTAEIRPIPKGDE